MEWTRKDLNTVTFVAIGNGLWLGFLLWLVLGVWLNVAGFVLCWIGATVFSWIVAIRRQYRFIELRVEFDEEGSTSGSKEVVQTLHALDDLERSATNAAFSTIKHDVQTLIRDADKTANSIQVDGMSPEGLAALIMSNIIQNHLCSGNYHIYRGVLTSGGEQLLQLWDFVIESMAKTGVHAQEEADDEKHWIRTEIKKVG